MNSQNPQDLLAKVDIIRDVFNYTQKFKGTLFVLKVEDTLLNSPYFPLFIKDVVQLQAVGIKVALVLGTRNLIEKTLEKFNLSTQILNGVRITAEEAMPIVQLADMEASQQVLALITANGAKGILGNWVKARAIGVVNGEDFQRSGQVTHIRSEIVNQLLDDGFIPILPNIGWNEVGRVYNINSNEIAMKFCEDLEVSKLFFIGVEDGIYGSKLSLPDGILLNSLKIISNLNTTQTKQLIETNQEQLSQSQKDFLNKSIRALDLGVKRVHLISGLTQGSILQEVFSTFGEGTMIYANRYYRIRPVKVKDISQLLQFMDSFIESKFLVNRTESQIRKQLNDYTLYEIDQHIKGCAALHDRGDGWAELAAVAVDPHTQSSGIGRDLVDHLIEKSVTLGYSKLYVFTTQAEDWFQSFGFEHIQYKELPEEAQERYSSNRNSKILCRRIG